MDDIISVLAIDFRPTSRHDDSYVSLCDTVHVSLSRWKPQFISDVPFASRKNTKI